MVRQKGLIITSVIFLLIFVKLLILVIIKNTRMLNIDLIVNQKINLIQNSIFIQFSKVIGIIFDTWCLIAIAILVSIYLWFKDSKKDAIFFSLTMFVGAGFIFILKELVQIVRPENILINETSYSFPSGHATIAVIFFGILTYLILKRDHSKFERKIAQIITPVMILVIGFTRIYLNAHWLSDVIAGYSLGIFILTASVIINNRIQKRF